MWMTKCSLCHDFVWQGQVKLKETALETSANSFLEKERDLLNKIEELEHRVEELNQKSVILSDNPCQKVSIVVSDR